MQLTLSLKCDSRINPEKMKPGEKGWLSVHVEIPEDRFIQANSSLDYMVPAKLHIHPAEGITFGLVHYPIPTERIFEWIDSVINVYSGKIDIKVPVEIARFAREGHREITGHLDYQGCTKDYCIPPSSEEIRAEFEIISET